MLRDLLTLSHVPRWAIIDNTKSQTVADHSFRVAAICLELIRELRDINVAVNAEHVLVAALTHDVKEAKSGDIPTPYKRKLATYGFLEDEAEDLSFEYYLVKIADLIEAITFLNRYGIRPERIKAELMASLRTAKHKAWEVMESPSVVEQGWWNRIVDKILEAGTNYE